MRSIAQTFLIITILVLSGGRATAVSKANPNDEINRAEAERLWELVIKAKGGRERLHAVNNVHTISREKYLWWFRLLTIDYQSLNVFPDKSWEWDDQRGSVFGFAIYLQNFEKNMHLAYRDTGNGAAVVPIKQPSEDNIPQLQLHLLTETKWVKPIPQSVRREKLDERDVDIVQTMVHALPKDEQKVDFALDRKTHLPLGFRSQSLTPPQALRHRRAPRAKANPTDDELDQSYSESVSNTGSAADKTHRA